jgi:polyglycine hydrolase-like protein
MSISYVGAWRAGADGHYLWQNADWASFQAKWNDLSAQGLRLSRITTFLSGDQRRWTGVWRAGSDAYYLLGRGGLAYCGGDSFMQAYLPAPQLVEPLEVHNRYERAARDCDLRCFFRKASATSACSPVSCFLPANQSDTVWRVVPIDLAASARRPYFSSHQAFRASSNSRVLSVMLKCTPIRYKCSRKSLCN